MFITWGYGRAMNYRQVEIFKAIMDRGSITEAARVLGISQPAVSKGLQLLEGELGLQLFTRTTKGIAATDEARALYAEVERAYFGMQNLAHFAGTLRDRKQGRVVVTVIPAFERRLASRDGGAVRACPSRRDPLAIFGQFGRCRAPSRYRRDRYRHRPAAKRGIHSARKKLFDLEGVIVLPLRHGLANQDDIRPEDLVRETIISLGPEDEFRRKLTALMDAAGVPYRWQSRRASG